MYILEMNDCFIAINIVIKFMFVFGFVQVCTKNVYTDGCIG